MSDAVRELWVWWFVGWGVVGVSLVLLVWGLWGWKPKAPTCRGRRCRYDLSATNADADGAVTCPECGRAMRTRRALLGRRRRRRVIIVSLVLLVLGWGARVYPSIRDRGLVAAIPSPVLVLLPSTSLDALVHRLRLPVLAGGTPFEKHELEVRWWERGTLWPRDETDVKGDWSSPRELGGLSRWLWRVRLRTFGVSTEPASGEREVVRVYRAREGTVFANQSGVTWLQDYYTALVWGDTLVVRATGRRHERVRALLRGLLADEEAP